jgi:hypothetical protein
LRWFATEARALATITTMAVLAFVSQGTHAAEDRSGLTRAKYMQRCHMCHGQYAPDGIAKEIRVGTERTDVSLRDALPGVECWRRCETCWPAPP